MVDALRVSVGGSRCAGHGHLLVMPCAPSLKATSQSRSHGVGSTAGRCSCRALCIASARHADVAALSLVDQMTVHIFVQQAGRQRLVGNTFLQGACLKVFEVFA